MKLTSLKALEQHLAAGAPKPIYLVLGKEAFERKSACDLLVAALLKGVTQSDLALQQIEGERASGDELLQELHTLSFFAPKRALVVNNADKLPKAVQEQLEGYFQQPNPAICLILSASAINHATNFYKKGEKLGVVVEFAEEKPWEKEKSVKEWVHTLAANEGKAIDGQAAQLLVKQIGTDQSFIFQEMQKLVCYVGDRKEISLADVGAVCCQMNVENGWQLGEAIFKRDAAGALRISKALLEEGTAVIALIRQIRSQTQTHFQICSLLAQGGGAAEVSRQFPYMRGQILDKNMQSAQSYGMPRFKKAMLKIDEMELLAKNSAISPELLMELLIVKLVT